MEEKKHNEQPKRLTYEELQAMAAALEQTNASLEQTNQRIVNEYRQLRAYVAEQQTQSIFAYLTAAQKIIDSAEMYRTEFVTMVTYDVTRIMKKLREIIVPDEEQETANEDGAGAE